MAEEGRVKYLFINLSRRNYIRLHIGFVVTLLAAAVVFLLAAGDSEFWWLRQAWWICLAGAGLDLVEAWLALRLAARPSGATSDAGA